MAIEEDHAVNVKYNDAPLKEGVLHYLRFNSTDRWLRALKVLLLFWLIAGITVFVPIAHFILVPSFFLAGPIMAFFTYRLDMAAKNAQVECPKCLQRVTITIEPKKRPPMYVYCPLCDGGLQLIEK